MTHPAAASKTTTCGYLKTISADAGGKRQEACHVKAAWAVGIEVTDKQRIESVVVYFGKLVVCNRHRLRLDISDVVNDRNWHELVRRVAAHGHRRPKRSYTKLAFKHLRLDEWEADIL